MSIIQIDFKDLQSRGEKIRELLNPLVRHPSAPAWKLIATPPSYIIGVHDGSPVQPHYRDWRFATFINDYRGMYFELWKRLDSFKYNLETACLSIYQTIDSHTQEEREFLSLHCDPTVSNDAPHAIYKRGPHLHIKTADDPIPRAHIALNRCHLDDILSSIQFLSEAIGHAIKMLKEEILEVMQ